jgi:hypothetical protein
LAQARGIAFELDYRVFDTTSPNLSLVDQDIRIMHGDYAAGLRDHAVAREETVIVFVAPPWGDALDPVSGLDLRRTQPPITDIIGFFDALYANNRILYVIQIHETIDQRSASAGADKAIAIGRNSRGLSRLPTPVNCGSPELC